MQRLRMASAGMLLRSLMCRTQCRGKWKWGRTDEVEVEESDIIMTMSEPCAVGNFFQVKAEEKYVVDRLFSSISVDL